MRLNLMVSTLLVTVLVACGTQPSGEGQEPEELAIEQTVPTATLTEQATSMPDPSPTATTTTSTPTSTATPQKRGTQVFISTGTTVDIGVIGSDGFVSQTTRALDLLALCAPDALRAADEFIDAIQESERSGMLVGEGVFLASEITAFAPGYSEMPQVFWYAGSIVHDAHHRAQSQQGRTLNWDAMTLEERETVEAEAREVQISALELCADDLPSAAQGEGSFMLKYLTDMQAGITECDYCKVEWENRNW